MRIARFAIAAAVTLAFATPALAQETRADRRQDRQEQRIDQGIKSGALTGQEVKKLEKGQAHVEKLETKAQADGKVTRKEKRRLEHAQDVQSKKIYRQKHDKQTR